MQSNNFLATPTTMKISTTVNRPQKVETEIELPYYFKDDTGWYYKVFSEDPMSGALRVSHRNYYGVGMPIVNSKDIAEGIPITEEEFNDALKTALTKIAEASGEVVSIMFYNEMPKPEIKIGDKVQLVFTGDLATETENWIIKEGEILKKRLAVGDVFTVTDINHKAEFLALEGLFFLQSTTRFEKVQEVQP